MARATRRASWGLLLILAVLLLVVSRACTRWPEVFVGSGPSMEPTVHPGEYFLVTGPVGELRRGMLVIFRFSYEDTVFSVLRRLVALPGDTISMRAGAAIVNGVEMTWPFLVHESRASRSELARVPDLYTWGPIVVPPDSVFLLSDTRDMVGWPDSRFTGPIAVPDLEGEALWYLWPRSRERFLRRLK